MFFSVHRFSHLVAAGQAELAIDLDAFGLAIGVSRAESDLTQEGLDATDFLLC